MTDNGDSQQRIDKFAKRLNPPERTWAKVANWVGPVAWGTGAYWVWQSVDVLPNINDRPFALTLIWMGLAISIVGIFGSMRSKKEIDRDIDNMLDEIKRSIKEKR